MDKKRTVVNIAVALAVGCAFLLVWLIGRRFFPQLGKLYTFDWVLRRKLLLAAAVIAAVPALFGKFRFSCSVFAGSCLGIFPGELLGRDPAGAPFGSGHHGWWIWIAVFLVSIAAGVFFEILHGKKVKSKTEEGS